jgi:hypothetical protein
MSVCNARSLHVGPRGVNDSAGGSMRRDRTTPPSSPMYYVTYIQVYSATPVAVTYGHAAGYMMGYVTAGVLVYGTGYQYPPVVVPGPVPIYYPYPYNYASNVRYNSSTGTWARGGTVYGPFGGAASGGRYYNPRRARTATSMRAVMATSIATTTTAGRNATTAGGTRCSSHCPTRTGVAATATSEPVMAVGDPTPSTAPTIGSSSRIRPASREWTVQGQRRLRRRRGFRH